MLLRYVRTPDEIYVDAVTWDGKDLGFPDVARARFTRWSNPDPAANDGAQVALFAQEQVNRAQERIKDLEVNIAGVSVLGAVKVVQKMLDPPYKLLRFSGETDGKTHYLLVQLVLKGDTLRQWRLSRSFDDPTKSDEARSQLIDAGVFRVLYELGGYRTGSRSASATRSGSRSGAGTEQAMFSNERTFEAYLRGSEQLNAYLRTQRQEDLDQALANLSQVYWDMPDATQALGLYALALSENRQEREAIRVYDRLLGGEQPIQQSVLTTLGPEDRVRQFQLELNRSQAYFYQYDVSSSGTSIDHLGNLRTLLREQLTAVTDREPSARLQSLLAYADAQLADVTGHLLSLLKMEHIAPADLVRVLNSARLIIGEQALPSDANRPAVADFATAVITTRDRFLAEARAADTAAGSYWTSDSADASSQHQALRRLLASAEGYTDYLFARVTATDAATFEAGCNKAVEQLERAYRAQPQNYTVLQNLGSVYADEGFDPNEARLAEAARYFERSAELKPNDYWAHQNLASIYGRQTELGVGGKLAMARTQIDRALGLRPTGTSIKLLSARIAMWEWASAPVADREKKRVEIEQLVLAPVSKRDYLSDQEWAKVAWAVHGVRSFQSAKTDARDIKAEFEQLKEVSIATLKSASAFYGAMPTWVARRLKERTDEAEKLVTAVTYERRDQLPALF
jgi:hypothetical protein